MSLAEFLEYLKHKYRLCFVKTDMKLAEELLYYASKYPEYKIFSAQKEITADDILSAKYVVEIDESNKTCVVYELRTDDIESLHQLHLDHVRYSFV